MDSENLGALFNKGNSLANLGKYEESIACYDRVIKINPKKVSAWRYKGMVLKKLGEDEEAEKCFSKSKELGFVTK